MANHLILQIRDAVVTLITGLSITGANVFTSRPEDKSLAAGQLPALWPKLGAEQLADTTLRGTEMEMLDHDLTIMVCVRQAGDYEAQLFNIARDVRNIIAANRNAGGALSIEYAGSAAPEDTAIADVMASRLQMFFAVKYATVATAVDTGA